MILDIEKSRQLVCQANRCPRLVNWDKINSTCIPGRGSEQARIMFIGEAPGQHEDREGKFFVGAAGRLLLETIQQLGYQPKDYYYSNVVRCATPGENVKPTPKTCKICAQMVAEEIEKIHPELIVCLGGTAAEHILGKTNILKIRNNWFIYGPLNIPALAVLHPSYILRNVSELELFRTGIRMALTFNPLQNQKKSVQYLSAHEYEKAKKTLEYLLTVEQFVFDVETSGLDYRISDIVSIQFTWKERFGVAIPWSLILQHPELHKMTKDLFAKINVLKIGQNIKFDIKFLAKYKIAVRGKIHDTMVCDSLTDDNAMEHNLEMMVLTRTDMGEYWSGLENEKTKICAELGINENSFNYSMLPWGILYPYGCADVDATMRIFNLQLKAMEKDDLEKFMYNYSMPFLPVLAEMEFRGVKIDRSKTKEILDKQQALVQDLQSKMELDPVVKQYEAFRWEKSAVKYREHRAASPTLVKRWPEPDEYVKKIMKEKDYRFNMNSDAQLKELFFDMLKLKPVKMTKPKNPKAVPKPSTDKEVLEHIATVYEVPFAQLMKDHNAASAFISGFLDPIYSLSWWDGRIHGDFLQAITDTGRLSSRNPNLQNAPRERVDFKECFIADEGMLFVIGDLAQAEFRVWANVSDDQRMIDDINSGLDIHRKTASQTFSIKEDEVTKHQRDAAKRGTFGMMYGIGSKTLASRFKITVEQAKRIIQVFSAKYPIATAWIYRQPELAHMHKKVVSILGRVRHLPHIDSDDQNTVAKAERQAMNSPIQSAASDLNNHYMTRILQESRAHGIKCYPSLTIHDANIIQVQKDRAEEVARIVQGVVTNEFPWMKCKMGVDVKIGRSVGSAIEWKEGA